jgi:hypothetical protein
MPRINLAVPFAEKDDAKRLGARWDKDRKVWYVPEGVDVSLFARWLPNEANITVRARSHFIARSATKCWACNKLTSVYGFVLPSGHEILEFGEEEDAPDIWCRYDEPAIVYYISNLQQAVVDRIRSFTKRYRVAYSKTTRSSYWMNHCEHCGMKQGDFEMYCEPGGAFYPTDDTEASAIILNKFAEPFSCDGSTAYGHLIEYMRRA